MGIFKKSKKVPAEFQKTIDLVNGYLGKFDKSIPPLGDPQVAEKLSIANTKLKYRGINVEVGVVLPEGKPADLILSAGVRLPPPGTNLLPVYQQLLLWNNFQTSESHFSINKQGVIFTVMRRSTEGLDYSEFEQAVIKVSETAAMGILLLKQQFGI
jgi:hypothetical protein